MKRYTIAGHSLFNGRVKLRFANDIYRMKRLLNNGHEDIHLETLPRPMSKREICDYFEGKPELADAIRRVRTLNPARDDRQHDSLPG